MNYVDNWNNSLEERPFKGEFDPYDGCLDALAAWEHFGGLSRDSAYTKFCENPEYYQEDFMFMGGVAFAYYYPVIERYILESSIEKNRGEGVEAMWILAHCIKAQVDAKQVHHHLRKRLQDLVAHVRSHLVRYSADSDERGRIEAAWRQLEGTLRTA